MMARPFAAPPLTAANVALCALIETGSVSTAYFSSGTLTRGHELPSIVLLLRAFGWPVIRASAHEFRMNRRFVQNVLSARAKVAA